MADSADLLVARLCGTATRRAHDESPLELAVLEVQAITLDPQVLGRAAGVILGGYRHAHERRPFAQRTMQILEAAGADPGARDAEADIVEARLRGQRRKPF